MSACRFIQKTLFKGSCQFLLTRNKARLYRDVSVRTQTCVYLIETSSYSCSHSSWTTLSLGITSKQEGRKYVFVALLNSECWGPEVVCLVDSIWKVSHRTGLQAALICHRTQFCSPMKTEIRLYCIHGPLNSSILLFSNTI